ncbi:MAG TPA: YwiC-like family protein, partial [Kofleriaceae bacterium]
MTRPRSLWPREHGAYVQLLVPLLTGLAARVPTIAAVLLAIAACAAFLANEPLLVVLGHRGARMKTRDGDRARARLVLLASIAFACGAGGLALAGRETLMIA